MQKFLDRFSITISALCAIHCLLTPVILTALPFIGLMSWNFHLILLFIIMPTTAIAIMLGCRRHKDKTVKRIAIAGICLLIAGAILGDPWFGVLWVKMLKIQFLKGLMHIMVAMQLQLWERILTIAGGLLLIISHTRNYYLCRHTHCEHEHA